MQAAAEGEAALGGLEELPGEVLAEVLQHLTLPDIGALHAVSPRMHTRMLALWLPVYRLVCPFFSLDEFALASECERAHGPRFWRDLVRQAVCEGWRFSSESQRVAPALCVSADGLQLRARPDVAGRTIVQRATTARGVCRGVHRCSFRVDRLQWGLSIGVCFASDDPQPSSHCWQMFTDGSMGVYNDDIGEQRRDVLRTLERLRRHHISLSKMYPLVMPLVARVTGASDGCPLESSEQEKAQIEILGEQRIVHGSDKQSLRAGDVVTVEVDLDRRSIAFFVNGRWRTTLEGILRRAPHIPISLHFMVEMKVSARSHLGHVSIVPNPELVRS